MIVRRVLKKLVKGYLRDFFWTFYGQTMKTPAIPKDPQRLLFICLGNICRSAYAHHYGVRRVAQTEATPRLRIASAGLLVRAKQSPDTAIAAAGQRGVDLDPHAPTQVTEEEVRAADMVLAMEPGQVAELRDRFPAHIDKLFLLAVFENGSRKMYPGWARYHIEDPYGKPLAQYTQCFERIERCVDGLLAQLSRS